MQKIIKGTKKIFKVEELEKSFFYDCYDENFKPITQIFCKDTKELLEEVPNVRYLLCMDFMVGRCFKKVSENGVGCIVKELDFIRRL